MNLKRLFDLSIGGTALIAASPLLLLISLVLWGCIGKPILFRQQRPGLRGKPFRLVKFRTMTDARDNTGILLPDSKRLLPVGRFLRSTSLDELPELWNVIKGDMSLVGPRPLLMEYLPLYSREQGRRHEVRPGITDGPRSTAAMISTGMKNLNWMSGMLRTDRLHWI